MRRIPPGGLLEFFALAYALMWTAFVSVAAAKIPIHRPPGALLVLLGAFAPSLAALFLTARVDGSAGVRSLLGRIFKWQVGPQWYLFAVGYVPAIKLTVALIHRVATGVWPRFGDQPWYVIPAAIAVSTPFQAGEEIGWPSASVWRGRASCSGSSGLSGTSLNSSSSTPTPTGSRSRCSSCK